MKKMLVILTVLAFFMICCVPSDIQDPQLNRSNKILSIQEVKGIVSKHIIENEYYQKFYSVDSTEFDPRVREISMLDPILVRNLSPSSAVPGDYYIVNGTLLDGQLLAAEAIDAVSGSFIEGKVWINDVDTRIATENELLAYARQIDPDSKYDSLTPVFLYDESVYSVSPLLSWKYSTSSPANSRSLDVEALLLDPFVKGYRALNGVSGKNANMSTIGFYHRAFKISGEIARTITSGNRKLVPID